MAVETNEPWPRPMQAFKTSDGKVHETADGASEHQERLNVIWRVARILQVRADGLSADQVTELAELMAKDRKEFIAALKGEDTPYRPKVRK